MSAFYGRVKPAAYGMPFKYPYYKNGMRMEARICSDAEMYTYLSSSATALNAKTFYGGENLDDETAFQSRTGASTSSGAHIPINVVGHQLHGTSEAERVGINYDLNPNGLEIFDQTFAYMRVRSIDCTFSVQPTAAHNYDAIMYCLFYRSDRGIPSFTLGTTGNAAMSSLERIPGMYKVRVPVNKGDQNVLKPAFRTFHIDVKKMFNDLEWWNDPTVSGNFWVAKDGSDNFTAVPTAEIRCRLYGIVLNPSGQTTSQDYHVGMKLKWKVEFDRGDLTRAGAV